MAVNSTSSTSRASNNAVNRNQDQGQTYTVKPGDNLSHIARDHNTDVAQILRDNPHVKNPNLIRPGMELSIGGPGGQVNPAATSGSPAAPAQPSESPAGRYTVRPGDNLNAIASRHDTTVQEMMRANPQISNPNLLRVGQELRLPGAHQDHDNRLPVQPGEVAPDPTRATTQSTLERGASGPRVEALQTRLSQLGFNTGGVDGSFGPRTQDAVRAFQSANELPANGQVNQATWDRLQSPDAKGPADAAPGEYPRMQRYEPGSAEAKALFREAARVAGVPQSWADSHGLHQILRRESNGQVGIPNYTYGSRRNSPEGVAAIHDELRNGQITARSSATGLGQLLLSNVDRYYPNGRAGIGDPVQEAAGMLRYIQDRYGNPDNAWRLYGTRHEGY
jgi:LysM repeat protein